MTEFGDYDPDDAFAPDDPDLASFTPEQLDDLERLGAAIDALPTDDPVRRIIAVHDLAVRLAGDS